jgi:hypothetical protein
MDMTTNKVRLKVSGVISDRSSQERAEIGSALFDAYTHLIKRFILQQNPEISEAGMKQQLFLKLYGDEFTADQIGKIFKFFQQKSA